MHAAVTSAVIAPPANSARFIHAGKVVCVAVLRTMGAQIEIWCAKQQIQSTCTQQRAAAGGAAPIRSRRHAAIHALAVTARVVADPNPSECVVCTAR